jgi:hypothetical protein
MKCPIINKPITFEQYRTGVNVIHIGGTPVSITITHVDVNVERRRLRATWTPELVQDLMAYHGIDAEAELTAMLSEEITAEIDGEIIRNMFDHPVGHDFVPIQPLGQPTGQIFYLDYVYQGAPLNTFRIKKPISYQTWKSIRDIKKKCGTTKGYIFAPYIPMFETPPIIEDPINFHPRQELSSRYSDVTINPEFYREIRL